MNAASKSIYYFGFYLYVVGASLIFMPNFLLSTIQIPETNEVWIRVTGVLALCLGYYYHRAGAENNTAFIKHTVPTRILVFGSFAIFASLKLVSPMLIIFGAADLVGAMITWRSLHKQ
ncbi:MAG: hypothetical protein EAZ12_04605 [Sphingobacteriia bacterium]|nr:MAG: hypothetical protein EAZ12_04605 [Sphingobacteriia bacterium]